LLPIAHWLLAAAENGLKARDRLALAGDRNWFRRGPSDPFRGLALELVAATLRRAFRRHVTAATRARRPLLPDGGRRRLARH